jgi:REP element-mobilizing transposase RayT
MPSKFDPQKHHRRSIRLPNYDYSQPGAYFATQQWEKLPKRFQNIELGAFTIMPNHMHGMIVMSRGTEENPGDYDGEPSRRAPTREQFQKPVKGSIPTIIRSYKSAVAYRISLMRSTRDVPVWQRNYYEHIIRNERDLRNKTDYIEANPLLWDQDDENPVNIKPQGRATEV